MMLSLRFATAQSSSPPEAKLCRQVFGSSLACLALALAPVPAMAGTPGVTTGVAGLVLAPADGDQQAAREAYNEGEAAYRLGKFEEAAGHFERAYELSGLLPDILYNIGLSHLRWYDVDPDVAHLRKAKVVFQNYVIEIQKNPDLGDLDEAQALIDTIDEKLAEAEAAARDAGGGDDLPPGPTEPVDYGPDPGKKLRLGGSIGMGVGGAFIVAGLVSGVVLGVRGQEFEGDLANAYNERDALGCTPADERPECDEVNDRIEIFRNNGQQANALAVGLGLTLGGIGVIGIVTGAVLFVQGNKKTKAWEQRQLSVSPSWGRGQAGLLVTGRF
jgi:tetratricopeptide (TPR) repeat protein